MSYPLVEVLLREPAFAGQNLARDALENDLEALYGKGRAAWPDITISAPDFTAYLAARLAPRDDLQPNGDVRAALAKVRVTDLYLACACARGDARAIALFDARFMGEIDRALRSSPSTIDETKQVLRRRFFVSESGEAPRITEYTGKGDLKAWVRAAAVRASWRVGRRPKGQTSVESHVMRAIAATGDDLELDYLKKRYIVEFEQALRDALHELPVRDRNVSRYYYGKGLSLDAIGGLYRVHRSTIARWLNRIAESIVEMTRKKMMERLGANRAEVSSLVRMLESRIDVALRAVLESESTA